MHDVEILDCTLRDGSYAINFQFTARDTAAIAGALERVGITLIEVGHGIGLGASEAGLGQAAESDEGYLRAAAETLSRAKWGMFCIPGIARLDHLDMAADYRMSFIRVGSNIDEVPASRPFIERAKRHGMFVCANFMKSYACAPEEFAELAAQSASYGADMVYLVDSAGGMMTEDVVRYVEAVKARTPVRIGFHGHNNLGLGVPNALAAARAGAGIVDTSLQGMGRSAGNTPTEQFVCVLARLGVDQGIDPIDLMDVGEHYILPLISARGIASLDLVSGLAQFHSSYMGVIREFSTRHGVDPRRLIQAVTARDLVNAPRPLVEEEARRLAARQTGSTDISLARFPFNRYWGAEQQ